MSKKREINISGKAMKGNYGMTRYMEKYKYVYMDNVVNLFALESYKI